MICKICEQSIESFSKKSEIKQFLKHLRIEHQMSPEKYKIVYEFNNIKPTCECGCGNYTKFKGLLKPFNKYYLNHKDTMPRSKESSEKSIKTKIDRGILTIKNKLKKLDITDEELKKYYNDFCEFKISLTNISKETGIDKRTIKHYWKEFKFINDIDEFSRIIKKHQGYWSESIFSPNKEEFDNLQETVNEIYLYILNNPKKHTLNEIKKIFNISNIRTNYLYKYLINLYDDKIINDNLKFHNSSQSEIEFFNVLKFYFGKNINRQFKLENKYYDYILGNKILIEYDGKYWHNKDDAKENDRFKNELALKYNYAIFRVEEEKSNQIETLLKITQLYKKLCLQNTN